MLKREAPLFIMLIVWVLRWVAESLGIIVEDNALEIVADFLLSLAGALWIRRRVFSENTIREAGLSPSGVKDRADDPEFVRYEGE